MIGYDSNTQVVADSAGKIVGFGSCGQARDTECINAGYQGEISTLYVLRAYQNSGLGSALFHAMTHHLAKSKLTTASLWVMGANQQARKFYERRGGIAFAKRTEDGPEGTIQTVAYGWDLTRLSA